MIVHTEDLIDEALQMFATSPRGVRYSDQYAYTIITTSETLEHLLKRALTRNDIVIVVPLGMEREMEDYASNALRIREERVRTEKEQIRKWVQEHPDAVKKFEKRL